MRYGDNLGGVFALAARVNIDLRELVDHLDENLRVVIVLHYFQDLPLGCPHQASSRSPPLLYSRFHFPTPGIGNRTWTAERYPGLE